MAIELRLSGGQNNIDPNASLGGQRSDTVITTDVLENLFDNIPRNEALIGRTEFRCIYIYNTGASHESNVNVEVTINTALTDISVGLDAQAKGDGRNTGIATTIATEDTSPTSVKFFSEQNSDDGGFSRVVLPIGLLFSGEGVPIWMKRKTESGPNQEISYTFVVNHDQATLPGDTVDDGAAFGELVKVVKQVSGTYVIGTALIGFSDIG